MTDLYWDKDEVESLRAQHTPANQTDNPYDRCALCDYTRHPCDVHSLASDWLILDLEIEHRDNIDMETGEYLDEAKP